MQIGDGGTTGSLYHAGGIANSGTLIFNRSDAYTYGGVVSGTGSLVQQGSGTLTLTAANTYTGGTTVASGTLLVNNTTGKTPGPGTRPLTVNAAPRSAAPAQLTFKAAQAQSTAILISRVKRPSTIAPYLSTPLRQTQKLSMVPPVH